MPNPFPGALSEDRGDAESRPDGATCRGLVIPHDNSFVGYGDPQWYQLLPASLTAMRLPVEPLADAVVQSLFARIDASKATGARVAPLTIPLSIHC